MWHAVAGTVVGAFVGVLVYVLQGGRGASNDQPQTPAHNYTKAKRVLLMGDSHAIGLTMPLSREAGSGGVRLDSKFGKYVDGAPLPYDTSVVGGMGAVYFGGSRVGALMQAYQPEVVLISLGGNDYNRTWDADRTRDAVRNIVSTVRGTGAVPVWLESPPLPFTDKIGVTEMWTSSGALRAPGRDLVLPHLSDKVHLTSAGYAEWAHIIWAWLREQALV